MMRPSAGYSPSRAPSQYREAVPWHEQETWSRAQGASTSAASGALPQLPAPGTIIAHRFPCTSCDCNAWTWLAFLVPDDDEVEEYKSVIDPMYSRRYEDFLVRQLGPLETDEYDEEFYDRRSCRRSVHDNDYDFLDLRKLYKTTSTMDSVPSFGAICSVYANKIRGIKTQSELLAELGRVEAELREEQRKGAELKQGLERLTGSKRKQRVTRSSAKELEGELEKEPERRTALKNLELSEGQLKQRVEKLKQLTCTTFLYDPDSFSMIVKEGPHGFDHEQFGEARSLWDSCGQTSNEGAKIFRNSIVNVRLAGAWSWGKAFMGAPGAGAPQASERMPFLFTNLQEVRSGACFQWAKDELVWSLSRKKRAVERVVLPVGVRGGEFECPICYASIATDAAAGAGGGGEAGGTTVASAVCCKQCNSFVACESCYERLFEPKKCPKCRALLEDSKLIVFSPLS